MGCKFSSTKEKDQSSQKSSVKDSNRPAPHAEAAKERDSATEQQHQHRSDNDSSGSPQSPFKQPLVHELAAADDNALEVESSGNLSPTGKKTTTTTAPQPADAEARDASDGESGSGVDLNGSFANVDLNGSFHIHYNTKGDIIPNATLPEGRRGRSVSPKLLVGISPHPSDDDIVLICTDCGMTIDEACEPLCPLTGKIHV